MMVLGVVGYVFYPKVLFGWILACLRAVLIFFFGQFMALFMA